jgi:hypothetical protein
MFVNKGDGFEIGITERSSGTLDSSVCPGESIGNVYI